MSISSNKTKLVINADDFGFTKGINKAILQCIASGTVTSTSVMVTRPYAQEAKDLIGYKKISIGLHLDFTEEDYTRWTKIAEILMWSEEKVERAFMSQIEKFIQLTGQLPHHIDSHHGIHSFTKFKKVVEDFALKNNIKVRGRDAKFNFSFYGRSLTKWYDQDKVSPHNLINIITKLSSGTHEIMCHPGYADEELLKTKTAYLFQRQDELKTLTDPKVVDQFEKIKSVQLISWNEA